MMSQGALHRKNALERQQSGCLSHCFDDVPFGSNPEARVHLATTCDRCYVFAIRVIMYEPVCKCEVQRKASEVFFRCRNYNCLLSLNIFNLVLYARYLVNLRQ